LLVKANNALFAFDNSYARSPDRFHARLSPTAVAAPRLVRLNEELALQLGLDPAELKSRNARQGVLMPKAVTQARAAAAPRHGMMGLTRSTTTRLRPPIPRPRSCELRTCQEITASSDGLLGKIV
jgi:hypothetical protein